MSTGNHKPPVLKLEVPERRPTLKEEVRGFAADAVKKAASRLVDATPVIVRVLKDRWEPPKEPNDGK